MLRIWGGLRAAPRWQFHCRRECIFIFYSLSAGLAPFCWPSFELLLHYQCPLVDVVSRTKQYSRWGLIRDLHRGPNYLLNQNGITLMVLMAICCYLSILIGLLAFFLDFLLMKRLQVLGVKIAALLHIFTALSSATAVGLCSCLFVIIIYNTKEEAGQINFVAAFGESFFFGIFSFSVSVCAAVLSFDSGRPVRRTPPLRNIFLMIPNSPPKVNVLQTDNDTNSFKISSGKHLTFKMY
ncbi:uncharacterized protein LOC115087092 isoform X2 [Rhinatrema bivittatum]|uniref:uncharacterized protein LOC115087092 isoform X2 n=1 Tax=Rhinatrema bivittatum TaxID=194408 RepID=UPI001129C9F0|nr:uncharacterized protein LOC115087092 isoform X2 [Rhinatrema bivittatum]